MKNPFFKTVLLLFSLMAVLASCNKIEDPKPQFLRSGNGLVLADNDNVVIAGYNTSTSKGYEATLIKVNATTGDTLWAKTYGRSYSDVFYSVKKSNTGGFIATGFSNLANASSPEMLVVITDANGKEEKSNYYGGTAASSQGINVLPIGDSGYLVSGYIQKTNLTDKDICLVKINNVGDMLWTKSYGAKSTNFNDTVNDVAYGVTKAPDGGYFLTGTLNGYSQNGGRIFLMKVSSTGDSLWTKTFGFGIGSSLTLTHENGVANGIAISGSLQQGSNQDIFLLKTDLDGKLLWKKTYGGSGFEYGANMIETSDGGFAIAGITDSKGEGNQDVYLILTNASGTSTAEPTYGGDDNDQGFGLIEMPDKGFCITGLSNSGGSFIFLNRVKADGSQSTGWPSFRKIE